LRINLNLIIKSKDKQIKETSSSSSENMFNIQLPYNTNQATKSDTWNSNSYSVSLHGSIKHFTSDAKISENLFIALPSISSTKRSRVVKPMILMTSKV